MHQAEVATRQGGDTHVFYFTALYSVQCGRRVPHGVRDESVGRAGVALDGHTDGTTGESDLQCGNAVAGHVQLREQPLAVRVPFVPLPERDQSCWLVA